MAGSQLSNSVRVNQIPPQTYSHNPRINVGVFTMRRAPDHIGWRLVASAVRRYRALSPEGRAIWRAVAAALFLAAILLLLIADLPPSCHSALRAF
jgi:hypothetical protein